ncbi:hypothetical protein MTO96_010404 [Rhipicephalus appendiculatus]
MRSAKKRALVASVEGERDLEEFKSEITNSMKDVRESLNGSQGAVMTLVETVTALTNGVDTLETRVGIGDSKSGFSGVVRRGLPSEAGGFRRADGVNHAIHADDLTVWCDGGSEGRVEESLQPALSCTVEFLEGTGHRLSPSKS